MATTRPTPGRDGPHSDLILSYRTRYAQLLSTHHYKNGSAYPEIHSNLGQEGLVDLPAATSKYPDARSINAIDTTDSESSPTSGDEEEPRNEFPFPRQPISPPQNKRLVLTIPNSDPDMDNLKGFPNEHMHLELSCQPPRSCPNNSVLSLSSPITGSSQFPSPTPSLENSSGWTPLSPKTPQTPANVFSLAAQSLKQLLLADELGMTVEEVNELGNFASQNVSGSTKRSGRILISRSLQKQIDSESSDNANERVKQAGEYSNGERQKQRITSADLEIRNWWKGVNWSRFSDSSLDTLSSGDSKFFDCSRGPFGECCICGECHTESSENDCENISSNHDLDESFPKKVNTRASVDHGISR